MTRVDIVVAPSVGFCVKYRPSMHRADRQQVIQADIFPQDMAKSPQGWAEPKPRLANDDA